MSIDAVRRLDRIRDALVSDGGVKVADLADRLGVSEVTVRRDLDVLEDEGVIRRVHGGAVPTGPQQFVDRSAQHGRAKERIARKLVQLVPDAGTVAFDASSTVQRLAAHLDDCRDLTIMTCGVEAMLALADRPGVHPLLTGGHVSSRTGSLVGPLAATSARALFYDVFFTSALAVHAEHGTSEPTVEEVEVKQALASNAARVVLAVDSSKLAARAAARCLSLVDVDLMVTELDPSDARLDDYRSLVDLA